MARPKFKIFVSNGPGRERRIRPEARPGQEQARRVDAPGVRRAFRDVAPL